MPWRRTYYRPYRYRRRRFWTWRPRPTFRRRRYRGRRKVRHFFKKKLKTITVKEYQPHSVRKCKVVGLTCLLIANKYRHGNNYTLYEKSIVPAHLPGGGCFSIMKFSLATLYEQHTLIRNWWTTSNKELPLVKYTGCKMYLYQNDEIDYVFRYHNSFPMTATQLMYATTQPGIMMLMKNSVLVPSTKTQKRKRPYKVVRIPPPSQFQKKWYFQKELYNTGLFLSFVTAASFNEYYIDKYSQSTNMTIHSLNTLLFTNRQFHTNQEPNGYHTRSIGTKDTYLYAYVGTTPNNIKIKDLIPLIETRNRQSGFAFSERQNNITDWNTWKNHPPKQSWGNPFLPEYAGIQYRIYYSETKPADMFAQTTQEADMTNKLTELSSQIFWELRYNPERDTGANNKAYLLSNWENKLGWDPPNNQNLIFEGYPLWALLHGYLDYQKRLADINQIDTHYILVIQTKATTPQANFIVPICTDFIKGNSPFEDTHNPLDENKWYPMVQYQEPEVNNILLTGPGTVKFDNNVKSSNIKCKYKFYFKFGGNPPPMTDVIDPQNQPIYPIPSNQQQTTSLQNPSTPIQYFLSNFDYRRQQFTETALKRITKDFETKETSFTDSRNVRDVSPQTSTAQTPEETTSEEEETQETLYEQLQHQRNKQKRIRQRILRLISQIKNLE
nr:MAG: ORF1 [TTV-like mini virus]